MPQPKYLTKEDLLYIEDNTNKTASELSRILDKPRPRIAKYLRGLLGIPELPQKSTHFNQKEIQYILQNKETLSYEVIAQNLNKGTKSSVHRVVKKFSPSFKKTTGIHVHKEDLDFLKQNYETLCNAELASKCNIPFSTLRYHAKKLKLNSIVKNRTNIEFYIADTLERLGVQFIEQYSLSTFRFDFYDPSLNLLIEVHGDYWHGNPDLYKKESLNHIQLERKRRDIKKLLCAKSLGYNVIYIWETDILYYLKLNKLDNFVKYMLKQSSYS